MEHVRLSFSAAGDFDLEAFQVGLSPEDPIRRGRDFGHDVSSALCDYQLKRRALELS